MDELVVDVRGWGGLEGRGGERLLMQMLEAVVLVGSGWVAAVVCDAISSWAG